MTATPATDEFDFAFGDWNVPHRRLRTRLAGVDDWQTFGGTSSTRPILGEAGNIEDNSVDFPGDPYRAIAVRNFDAVARTGAIWWLDDRAAHHLDVPVIGGYTGSDGEFRGDDVPDGRSVRLRFLWLRTGSDRPRRKQALSDDDGRTWETNWTMDFTRA